MVLWYMYLLLNNSIHIHIHCPLTLGFAVFKLGFYFSEDFFSSVLRTSLPIGRTVQFVLGWSLTQCYSAEESALY